MRDTPLETQSTTPKHAALPAELEEALIELLAQALVAELMETANTPQTLAEANATVGSPSGSVRTVGDALTPVA